MLDLDNIYCYLDNIIVISNSSFDNHMAQVDEVLGRLHTKGMQIHLRKSTWVWDSVEYSIFIKTCG